MQILLRWSAFSGSSLIPKQCFSWVELLMVKAVYYKPMDVKMCECEMNSPPCSPGSILLWVVWLIVRKLLDDAQPDTSITGPSLPIFTPGSAFQQLKQKWKSHFPPFCLSCCLWTPRLEGVVFGIRWEEAASLKHNCVLLFSQDSNK